MYLCMCIFLRTYPSKRVVCSRQKKSRTEKWRTCSHTLIYLYVHTYTHPNVPLEKSRVFIRVYIYMYIHIYIYPCAPRQTESYSFPPLFFPVLFQLLQLGDTALDLQLNTQLPGDLCFLVPFPPPFPLPSLSPRLISAITVGSPLPPTQLHVIISFFHFFLFSFPSSLLSFSLPDYSGEHTTANSTSCDHVFRHLFSSFFPLSALFLSAERV